MSYRIGHRKNAELPLLRREADSFKRGDILLGDKGFCSYYDVWKFKERGVDSLITLPRRKPVEAASVVAKLGPNDLLIQWPKPAWNKVLSYSQEEWRALPDQLNLRQIKVNVTAPGLRAKTFYLVTTLTDATRYSADELADLYYQRWDVELFFRDIKTTIGMDVLRCRTPALVEKEILMHFIAYNAVRLLMLEAANESNESPRRISFKSSIQALRQWAPQFSASANNSCEHSRLMALLCEAIAADLSHTSARAASAPMFETKTQALRAANRPAAPDEGNPTPQQISCQSRLA